MNSLGGHIWDLRQGDADDNRTSPYGRGWRNVVISAAMEFNYLTATVSFIMLVILPALLVGLAPPLFIIYSRKTFGAAAAIYNHPIYALFTIGVLIVLGIRLLKPLWSMALDNLWHLHYTLVVPLFVGLRETISLIMERIGGETRASADLDRRRRVGTLGAVFLLASASLVVISVGVLAEPALSDVLTQPWAVVRAGASNAVILVSLSTFAASLFWLWRELTSRLPLRNWTPEARTGHAPIVRVAHLSDLHVVGERYGYRMESGTHGPSGNSSMQCAIERLRAIHAATPLDRVLVTGDVTDAGTRAEWIEFIDLLQRCPDIQSRVLFIPGNHDVNIVDRSNTGRFDLPWSVSHALRRLRFLVAFDDVQGDRVRLVDGTSGTLGPTLSDYLQDGNRPAILREFAEQGTWRGRWAIGKIWEEIFPLVDIPGESTRCGVILLDSNARSHFSATNAIGVISRNHLKKLRRVLNAFPDCAWLILLHHHIVEYPVGSAKLSDRIALSLMNAPDVLSVLASHASHVVVFHGHRHHDWIGTKGGVVLCSAPSVALGSVGPDLYHGSFHVNELALVGGGVVRLTSSERVMVS